MVDINIISFLYSVIFDDGGASEIMILSFIIPNLLNRAKGA